MCGIAGRLITNSRDRIFPQVELLERMAGVMVHRGPDASGVWTDRSGRIGLAHRRLSILDLDARSNQPMHNEDGSVAISFNGEIYNFQTLREGLLATGRHHFRTASDTEVLVHLYEEHGEDVAGYLNKLRGMFAFGLWDAARDRLLLARDPVGKKPLYYAQTKSGLAFASTISALLQDVELPRRINTAAIRLYLVLGFVPAPFTAFEGISKLPAGHYLLADARGSIKVARYWSLRFEPKLDLPEAELAGLLLRELEEATRLRMTSDVPLGVFLSGGLDSSAIVALMSRISPHPVKTFAVGFPGARVNEARYARIVAERFGCDHTELNIDLKPEAMPDLVRAYEEPFADYASIPTYFMSKAARQHITVALNGDGGDEDFAGYTLRHISYRRAENLPVPRLLGGCLVGLAELLPRFLAESSLPYRAKKTLSVLGARDWHRNVALMQVFSASDLRRMWQADNGHGDEHWFFGPVKDVWEEAHRLKGLDRELLFSFALHLPEQLLVKVDRAAMAWGLEIRSPLLDRNFIELCARIEDTLKLRGRETKHIFRVALRGLLPEEVLLRPKQGFNPPMARWLRKELRPLVEQCLLAGDSYVGQHFRQDALRRLVREHLDEQLNHERRLYTLLHLELWARQFIRPA